MDKQATQRLSALLIEDGSGFTVTATPIKDEDGDTAEDKTFEISYRAKVQTAEGIHLFVEFARENDIKMKMVPSSEYIRVTFN